jgi:pilus assembly protein TadC
MFAVSNARTILSKQILIPDFNFLKGVVIELILGLLSPVIILKEVMYNKIKAIQSGSYNLRRIITMLLYYVYLTAASDDFQLF